MIAFTAYICMIEPKNIKEAFNDADGIRICRRNSISSEEVKYGTWMRELNFFLRLQVKETAKETMIHQQKYIKELLKMFDMDNTKIIETPIATTTRLDMDELGSSVDEKEVQSPKESYLKVVKKILRYLKGTQDLVLWYPNEDSFDLIGYTYGDYAGYLVDRKSWNGSLSGVTFDLMGLKEIKFYSFINCRS
nr:uncharacterized protein LOC104102961 [Nicotiana tomentosiformis]